MSERKEEYVQPDGTRLRSRQRGARMVSPGYIAELAIVESRRIPVKYFVASAERESSFATNEVDTEPNGYISEGLYQLSKSEASDVGMAGADLLDPVLSTRVFAKLQERRLSAIAKLTGNVLKEPDVWAYLAIAHNQGLGACLKTIKMYGLDWKEYKARNPTSRICAYGDACISGGSRWREVKTLNPAYDGTDPTEARFAGLEVDE